MEWKTLISSLEIKAQGGSENPQVLDITYDSRGVKAGTVFVAIPGFKVNGDQFIASAIEKGAVAVVSENPQPSSTIAWIQVADARKALSLLAQELWHINFKEFETVGITGTNGKTTTAMFYRALHQVLFGSDKAWLFGTISYKLGNTTVDAKHTTPEASDLLRYVRTASVKPKAITMEVSSHALALNRVAGFTYDIVVWTNLTQDHLDFHGDMETYYDAKKQLFTGYLKDSGIAVINLDDPWGKRLSGEIAARKLTYGFDEASEVRITDAKTTWDGTTVAVLYKNNSFRFSSKLCGFFNVYNMTALIAGALGKGYSSENIQHCFEIMRAVPGRMERVAVDRDFSVVVDYAHTPDALENVLATAAKLTSGRLWCVFGCGGDRDRSKRPRMAEAVARHSDEAIITTDNPRTENPTAIIEEILEGIPLDFPHQVIADRHEAISKALSLAGSGDCVVIAGKGHETYQEVMGVRHHFDDREQVMAFCKERSSENR